MSIIHDALKKAQEQRTGKPDGVPFGGAPEAKKKPQFIVIGIVALVAVIVLAYLYIPYFHPKKATPVKQAVSAKPAAPASVPPPEAKPQEPQQPKPAAVQTAMDVRDLSAEKAVPKKINTVAASGSRLSGTATRPEPAQRRSKAAEPAADEEPIRRIPARRVEENWLDVQYNEAVRLMNAGQMREAQKAFFAILGKKPDHVEVLNNMGVISASLGNKKEAVAYFKKVLELKPGYSKAYNNMGLIMMSEGDTQLAQEYFQKAISMEPEGLEPYLNLAALLRGQKKFPEAAKALEYPISRNVKDLKLFLSYAVIKDNMGQTSEAIRYYRQYLGLAKPSQARDGVVERLRYLEERGKR